MKAITSRVGYDLIEFDSSTAFTNRNLLVTFSDVNADGIGMYDSKDPDFEGLRRVHVRSKRKTWYHEGELINDLEHIVSKENDAVFVGTRVGGYAAMYLSTYFDCRAICFSPFAKRQPTIYNSEVFDEEALLQRRRTKPALIFFDPKVSIDQVSAGRLLTQGANVHAIAVSYGGSPTRAILREAGISRRLLSGVSHGGRPSVRSLRKSCERAYLRSPKSIAFRLREEGSQADIERYLQGLSNLDSLDADHLYFITDLLLISNRPGMSVRCALLSADKSPSSATILKAATTIEKVEGSSSALLYLSGFYDSPSLSPAMITRINQLGDKVRAELSA